MTAIGGLPWDAVLAQARALADLGGPKVPDDARELADLAVMGPPEITAVSRELTRDRGAVVLSSGGTTGRPKITHVAYDSAVDRLLREWRPLRPDSVMLNLFTPGRMWASHYYMQALAERCRCRVVPAGPYAPDEVADWIPVFAELGTDLVAGTPTALADLAQGVLDSGRTLPLRDLIWMAEPWTDAKERVVREAFPGIRFWANYGSVETYVMATGTPDCDTQVVHLMADQVMEPDDRGALLTRTGEGWTVPVVRYRLGDRVAPAECRCGRPDALRVVGRADDAFKLKGALVGIGEVQRLVAGHPGVVEAQLVLTRSGESPHAARELVVRFTGTAEPDEVHRLVLRQFYDLGVVAQHYPDAISTERVDRLARVERTNKVPPMVWLDQGVSRGTSPGSRETP